jgi:hypothetical protein
MYFTKITNCSEVEDAHRRAKIPINREGIYFYSLIFDDVKISTKIIVLIE